MSYTEQLHSKLITVEELQHRFNDYRPSRVVFTNGCFDILHVGHVTYLTQARDLGDMLIVGLNSDASVRRLKGLSRPINDRRSRALVLSALMCVDAVIIFEEDTPRSLIAAVMPDILVKGGDYEVEQIVGYDIVTGAGGQVLTLPIVEGFSTTAIVERMGKEVSC